MSSETSYGSSLLGDPLEPLIKDISWSVGPPLKYAMKGPAGGALHGKLFATCGTHYPVGPYFKYRQYYKKKKFGNGFFEVVDVDDEVLKAQIESEMRIIGPAMISDRAWLYDPAADRYEDLPNAPAALNWPDGLTVGDDFYLMGGMVFDKQKWDDFFAGRNTEQGSEMSRQVWKLTKESGAWNWVKMPPMPYFMASPMLAAVGRTIVAAGGAVAFDKDNPLTFKQRSPAVGVNSVKALDTDNLEKGWYDLPPIPGGPRSVGAIAAVGRKVYLFGGFYSFSWLNYADKREYYRDAFVFDMDTWKWRKLPDFPFKGYGWKAVVYGGREIVVTAGIRISNIDFDRSSYGEKLDSGNFDVVIFDTELESYKTLPSRVPPFPLNDSARKQIAGWFERIPPHKWWAHYDWARGIYRQTPKFALLGETIYMWGGDVLGTPVNASNELMVGKITK